MFAVYSLSIYLHYHKFMPFLAPYIPTMAIVTNIGHEYVCHTEHYTYCLCSAQCVTHTLISSWNIKF